jgi:hypothetical protein
MNKGFKPTCNRYGHLIAVFGGPSTETNRLFDVPRAEQIALVPRAAQSTEENLRRSRPSDSQFRSAEQKSPIQRILIPVDAAHTVAADLRPILELARHSDAQVTLLHCYTAPPSFDYAVGPSALAEVGLHRRMVKAQLFKLCKNFRKSFPKCRCLFKCGSLPTEILRASGKLQADLIAVPLSLDFVSHCWTTKDLLDELVRRANCAVLGVPSVQGK